MIGFGFSQTGQSRLAQAVTIQGAVAIYSTSRRFVGSGPLLRARRADGATADISSLAELDTFAEDQDVFMARLYDQTGRFQDLVATADATQYRLALAGEPEVLGGRLCALAPDTARGYRATLAAAITGSTLQGYFVGRASSATSTAGRHLSAANATQNDLQTTTSALVCRQSQSAANDRSRAIRSAATANITIAADEARVWMTTFDGTNMIHEADAYASGGATTVASTGAFNVTRVLIGMSGIGTNASPAGARFAEAIVWETPIDGTARAALIDDAEAYYTV